MTSGLNNQDDEAHENGRQCCPYVGAYSQEDLAGVDPDRLPYRAADAVPDQVHREEASPLQAVGTRDQRWRGESGDILAAQAVLALDVQQEHDTKNIPDDFVEERRVEQGALRQSSGERGVRRLDLQAPRKVSGQAKELMVEPVAEASESLSEQDAGSERIRKAPEPHSGHAAADPGTDRTTEQGAEDG